MSDLVGRQLGPYQMLDVLLRRRTVTIYRATLGDRPFSVSVLPEVADPALRAAVLAQAQAVGALRHPNIVPVEDTGEQDGYVYLVQEYVEGRPTLASVVGHPAETMAAVRLVAPLLSALDYVHEQGVVHGDIGPRHIALPSPLWPMLTDFAVGRDAIGAAASQSGRRPVLGTPAYLAPEQAFGLPARPRTDIYSMGIVFFELLTGRPPFEAAAPEEVLRQQAYEPPPSLRALRPDIPVALEQVVARALAKQPQDRPATAGQFADELWAALSVSGVSRAGSIPPGLPVAAVAAVRGRQVSMSTVEAAALPGDPLAERYAAGVAAFADERWDDAVALLAQVAQTDPSYEDVEVLLQTARAARRSSRVDLTDT